MQITTVDDLGKYRKEGSLKHLNFEFKNVNFSEHLANYGGPQESEKTSTKGFEGFKS